MKQKTISYLDFSGLYKEESENILNRFSLSPSDIKLIDLCSVPSTNCYCDNHAASVIREKLNSESPSGIHFLDSGNYHYATIFFLEKIEYDFALFLIDNHPDIQPPAFGDILSCGGWIYDALNRLPHLKEVYMAGVNPVLIEEVSPLPDTIKVISSGSDISTCKTSLPLYISVDKDALSEKYAASDWDQGTMELKQLTGLLSYLDSESDVIGIDICGEKKNDPTAEEILLNRATNTTILSTLLDIH
ncbi:MAG: hypothetical protein K6F00_01945 [Lachnospiraceae bacterium]|nr:hypothetical protein [Lachnospiraceae bacterium]